MRLRGIAHLLAAVALLTGACTTGDTADDSSDAAAATKPAETPTPTSESPEPSARETRTSTPTSTPAPTKTPAPEPPHRISVRAMIEEPLTGGNLRVRQTLDDTGAYTRHSVTYRSQGLRISGIMNVPAGEGPFPVLILNHGYIDPDVYVTGQGLAREQDWLARRGYVVLHTDYRDHAGSDDDPSAEYRLRLPYAQDVLNAVRAVKRSDLPYLDRERVGLFGRSMGGNVTLNALVMRPGLVDAATIYASTSSLVADNWRQFQRDDPEDSPVTLRMQRTYGLPAQSPAFWRAASPRPYFDRVNAPLLIHHGTADDTCPIRWSRETLRALRAEGKRARLIEYEGEGHTMYAQWERSMRRTDAFFQRHLR